MTDNAKFGSTYSAKKVSLEAASPSLSDPFASQFTSMPAAEYMYDDELDGDEDSDNPKKMAPKDTIET